MKHIICLNHIIRPEIGEHREKYEQGNHGDCKVCIPDKNNVLCCGYKPIEVFRYETSDAFASLSYKSFKPSDTLDPRISSDITERINANASNMNLPGEDWEL